MAAPRSDQASVAALHVHPYSCLSPTARPRPNINITTTSLPSIKYTRLPLSSNNLRISPPSCCIKGLGYSCLQLRTPCHVTPFRPFTLLLREGATVDASRPPEPSSASLFGKTRCSPLKHHLRTDFLFEAKGQQFACVHEAF